MILLTVGSAFPFDRLVGAMDRLVGQGVVKDEVFAQVGVGGLKPRHMKAAEVLDKAQFDALVRQASSFVGHAGMGTITMALDLKKPLLVVPRRREHREIVNDHQVETARRFEEEGQVLAAFEVDDLPQRLAALSTFVPRPRTAHPDDVAHCIGAFLETLR